jgi:phosphotransferase system HPr (HPr) family protein
MIKRQYTIKLELGVHARPSSTLAKCMQNFNLEKADMSYVNKEGEIRRGSMKSIIELLMICAPYLSTVTIELSGRDEQKAAECLDKFFSFEDENDLYRAYNPDLAI